MAMVGTNNSLSEDQGQNQLGGASLSGRSHEVWDYKGTN
jgi:hypothetical protein